MTLSHRLAVLVVAMLTLLVTVPLAAQPVKLVAESYHVPARDPGIQLHVRNKRPSGMTQFSAEKTLLYVHGTSQAASYIRFGFGWNLVDGLHRTAWL